MDNLTEKRALYPRVTEIIGKQNADEMRAIPIENLIAAGERGAKIHAYCTAWVNHLWTPDISAEHQPYVDAFIAWTTENIRAYSFTSKRLYDDELKFSGEYDLIGIDKEGKRVLIDIKTSCTKSKTWALQLAAYKHLCQLNGYEIDRVCVVHLKKIKCAVWEQVEGEKLLISPPQVKSHEIKYEDITPYWDIFASALMCYNYFDRKEVPNVCV